MPRKNESRQRKSGRPNNKIIIIAIGLGAVLIAGAVAAASFSATQSASSRERNKFGGVGSAHDHAAFIVRINGNDIDFSASKYQVKSPYIHVENGVGTTIHMHALSVPFDEFLKSINMAAEAGCFVTDDGQRFCDSGDMKLRFFVNGQERQPSSILSYVPEDNDRFLIMYGNETLEQVGQELVRLENTPIFKS